MTTPSEIEALWSLVGKAGTFIAAIVALIKGYQFLRSLSPAAKVEKRMDAAEAKLQKDYEHLDRLDKEVAEIKKSQQKYGDELQKAVSGINKIGTSQISLLRHMADGNGVDELRAEAEDLTKFFIIEN